MTAPLYLAQAPTVSEMTSKCSFRRWCQVPASCSCVFHPLVSGEDHPIKQGGWSEQKAGCQLGHRGQKGISANGAQQELRLGRSASLALGVGPEGKNDIEKAPWLREGAQIFPDFWPSQH